MPGLVGFTAGSDRAADLRVLEAMQEMITHFDFYRRDALSADDRVCISSSYPDLGPPQSSSYLGPDLRVWLDGEIYDRGGGTLGPAGESSDPEFVAALFRGRGLDDALPALSRIDGVYCAVVHDRSRENLHLITDRYGLRHLYWTVLRGQLVWASELKAFLVMPGFEPKIDSRSVDDFLSNSHFTDDRTWFDTVRLLPSASVLTWDLRQSSQCIGRYWSWAEIRQLPDDVDEVEVVEELGRLFLHAVRLRCRDGDRAGVALSGGLDSRAIVAAMPEQEEAPHLFTWGRRGCRDIQLAGRVSEVRGGTHHAIEISGDSWLDHRLEAVWWLDGQMNILDMHYLHILPAARELIDVNLNGFLGGNVLGGEYLDYPGSDEVTVIETRGRRHIWGGLRLGWLFYKERPVFFANDLLDLTLSVPPRLRRKSRLYSKMLLYHFPAYYRHIPWQRTGCPISWPSWAVSSVGLLRSARYGVSKRLKHLGINLPDHRSYADYNSWLLQEPARSLVANLLFSAEARYPQYASRHEVERLWQRHQAGARCSEALCRFLTFEIWLRQVFGNEFRPDGNHHTGIVTHAG